MVLKMRNNFRVLKASLLMGMVLMSVILSISGGSVSAADRPKLLSFNSYIDIEYDSEPLNEDLAIEKSINIPLTIKYRTDVPEGFPVVIPNALWQIKNWILYGSMIGPMQKIHVEVVDKPSWADISISQPDMFINIPTGSEETSISTSLVISPREEAPAVPQSIVLKVECDTIGRINGVTFEETVHFTPSFVPTITITPENPTRTVTPRESVNFKIAVKNNANKKIRVTPAVVGIDTDKWTPTINPPFHDIESAGQEEFIFSIYTPYDFGWHNEIESFQIDFTAKIFPLREEATVGGPYSIYLRVNNYGFSTPGFELLTFVAALVIAGLLIRKKYSTE